jgi:hypothetical protein
MAVFRNYNRGYVIQTLSQSVFSGSNAGLAEKKQTPMLVFGLTNPVLKLTIYYCFRDLALKRSTY